ncbi:MAG TPA: PA2779 family protein [Ramlibacter sp.]|uniref:PA2779 family protein n=1 Tax=Ramlibacter sp. TaxID=1917967 RepID=UPI002C94D84A|nr:PA2779 family protein [Ramlibacter sp.]HVZ46206.1 PA2779 family protein [Ramlibacter sp.]
MISTMKKTTCRLLVTSLLALSFQTANAGMIGADKAAPSPSTERAYVLNALDRAEVASQLLTAGVDPMDAKARVAAMSDQEVRSMMQDMQAAPVGASDAGVWIGVLIVVGLVWYFAFRK